MKKQDTRTKRKRNTLLIYLNTLIMILDKEVKKNKI